MNKGVGTGRFIVKGVKSNDRESGIKNRTKFIQLYLFGFLQPLV